MRGTTDLNREQGELAAEDMLMTANRMSLLRRCDFNARTFQLHDVICSYLVRKQIDKLPALHGTLVDGYHAKGRDLAREVDEVSEGDKVNSRADNKRNKSALHNELLEAYKEIDECHPLPEDGYFYNHLIYHLEQAGRIDEIHALFCSKE